MRKPGVEIKPPPLYLFRPRPRPRLPLLLLLLHSQVATREPIPTYWKHSKFILPLVRARFMNPPPQQALVRAKTCTRSYAIAAPRIPNTEHRTPNTELRTPNSE